MTTQQDCSFGLAKESTYGTGVTPTRFPEFIGDESVGWDKNVVQGQGLRVGRRVARSGRRVVPTVQGGGDWTVEALSKGQGMLWEGCLGASTSTLVSGSTYQQVFTLGDTPPSWTMQKGVPRVNGTIDAYTYLGAMVAGWEFNLTNAGIATLKMSMDIRDVTTATAYASPSYPAEPVNLYHFANATLYSGTLTAPTATALASALTPLASVRSLSLACNNNLANDRFNMGSSGKKDQPVVGLRELSGSIVPEYIDTSYRDAVLNETPMTLLLNLVAGSLSTGLETLQIVVPEIKFDNELVKANGGNLATQTMNFAGLDNLTAAQPLWVVQRTADTAI